MSCGWQWRLLHAVTSNFIFTTKSSFYLEFWNCIMRHIIKWKSFFVTRCNCYHLPILMLTWMFFLCNYLIELNFKCSWFWTTWKFFLWRSKILLLLFEHFVHIKTLSLHHIRTYKHDRKESCIIKWVIGHAKTTLVV